MASEERPREHLRRIHCLLVSSLQCRVPIITAISAYAARKRNEDFYWQRIAEHSILIVRVPKEIAAATACGFIFQFVEPWKGKLCEGYVYAETTRGFRAIKTSSPGYVYSETTKEFVHLKGLNEQWIENGFLHVISPSLYLGTLNEPWYARTFMTLDHGLGKFSTSPIS